MAAVQDLSINDSFIVNSGKAVLRTFIIAGERENSIQEIWFVLMVSAIFPELDV